MAGEDDLAHTAPAPLVPVCDTGADSRQVAQFTGREAQLKQLETLLAHSPAPELS